MVIHLLFQYWFTSYVWNTPPTPDYLITFLKFDVKEWKETLPKYQVLHTYNSMLIALVIQRLDVYLNRIPKCIHLMKSSANQEIVTHYDVAFQCAIKLINPAGIFVLPFKKHNIVYCIASPMRCFSCKFIRWMDFTLHKKLLHFLNPIIYTITITSCLHNS